jgi:glycosyltransferase involved in cell wall biosynthesis
MNRDTAIVVPCYNEAARFPAETFREFAEAFPRVRFVFVNDGSTDGTAFVLRRLSATLPQCFECLDQDRNRGKAEAVRRGMLHAIARGGRYAGYWDADLATPLSEIPRFIEALEKHPDREICFGARVQLLGRNIQRRRYRHYIGRVFATIASLGLGLPVYDTQCGAKLFRLSHDASTLFAQPFIGRWSFDIELVARLAQLRAGSTGRGPIDVIYELPLDQWCDVDGSKVRPADFVRAVADIARIRRTYQGRSDLTPTATVGPAPASEMR